MAPTHHTPDNAQPDGVDPFLAEILAQPDAMRDAAAALVAQADRLERLRHLVQRNERPLVLTGMGSSYDSLIGLSSVLGRAGIQTVIINTAELVNFQLPTLHAGAVVIAVSQSGRSAEIIRLTAELAALSEVTLVSITNGPDSPLAHAADLSLDMNAGEERGPSTKTYVATLVVLAAIARLITDGAQSPAAVAERTRALSLRAAEGLELLFSTHRLLTRTVAAWADGRSNVAIVGRGVGLATAELAALILKEAAQCAAQSMDAAEFRHGPLELAGPDLAVAVISLEPATLALDRRLVTDLTARGSSVFAIGMPDAAADVERVVVESVDPLLDAAVAAAPLQLLAWHLAAARHDVPGLFTVGSKVTTEE